MSNVSELGQLIDCTEEEFREFCKDKDLGYLSSFHNLMVQTFNEVQKIKDELVQKIAKIKNADGQDPIFNQKIIERCLSKMDFDEHLKKISQIYGRKCHLMVEGLKKSCSPKCKILEPEGGMFVWVTIPEEVDINALSDAVIAASVGVVKSEAFAVDANQPGHAFRLNFSASLDDMIVRGTEIFGQITREFCDK